MSPPRSMAREAVWEAWPERFHYRARGTWYSGESVASTKFRCTSSPTRIR